MGRNQQQQAKQLTHTTCSALCSPGSGLCYLGLPFSYFTLTFPRGYFLSVIARLPILLLIFFKLFPVLLFLEQTLQFQVT